MWAETVVCPAVEHLAAFDSNVASGRRRLGSSSSGRDGRGGNGRSGSDGSSRCTVRSVEPSIAGGESTSAFLVAQDELGLEGGDRPFGNRAQAKFFSGGG